MSTLYRKVKDADLFAAEAQYHNKLCYMNFLNTWNNHLRAEKRAQLREGTDQERQTAAHNDAFQAVTNCIQENIVTKKNVMQLSALRLIYINVLDDKGFQNNGYRHEKLMRRLENDPISSTISFQKVNQGDRGNLSFYLIYSNSITIGEAIVRSYSLGSIDKCTDVALLLRGIIKRAFKETSSMQWPPTIDDLDFPKVPDELTKFLCIVMGGQPEFSCERTKRLVMSISQDIYRSVTAGEWKLPNMCCFVPQSGICFAVSSSQLS